MTARARWPTPPGPGWGTPLRATDIEFTAPYVVIEGTYVMSEASPLRAVEDVDHGEYPSRRKPGQRLHLFLARTLRHATLVTTPTGEASAELFLHGGAEVLAGVRQPNDALVQGTPELRAIPGRFMSIQQAVGLPVERGAGADYLRAFVEDVGRPASSRAPWPAAVRTAGWWRRSGVGSRYPGVCAAVRRFAASQIAASVYGLEMNTSSDEANAPVSCSSRPVMKITGRSGRVCRTRCTRA